MMVIYGIYGVNWCVIYDIYLILIHTCFRRYASYADAIATSDSIKQDRVCRVKLTLVTL